MGLGEEFREGLDWVKSNLDFDVDGEVSVFETSIRLVGGLLSAFHASGDPMLLTKARDCADRLLPSFAASPIGIPHRTINLRTGALERAGDQPRRDRHLHSGIRLPQPGHRRRPVPRRGKAGACVHVRTPLEARPFGRCDGLHDRRMEKPACNDRAAVR